MARRPPSPVYQLPFKIVVDNAEQMPWRFTDLRQRETDGGKIIAVPLITDRKLRTGDYSIDGLEHLVTIERKSKSDLFGTLGVGRERFEREFERMAEMQWSAVVVEADWQSILDDPPERSGVSPESVEGTILSWSHRFPKTHWFLCQHRRHAEHAALRLLMNFHRRYIRSLRAA